ncbi:MAG: phosphoribosylamine--glycine ligase, partial [Candidatus Methanoperedens sp.]|nr:phosphoribosylamine--glycine ligase [Candidatus Methanoperedens sp.]
MNEKNKLSVKRVLVVGSWAKEQITIENLSSNPDVEIFSYMDIRNPGIISLVKGYQVGSFYDISAIVNYAREQKIDLVIITTASPLSRGLVDALEANRILAFGPVRLAAQLEANKEFTRKLLQKYLPSAIPEFEVFDNSQNAIDYAKKLDWQVAVKPIGLTEGLGVRVFGEQLKDENEVREYIQQVINNRIGGSSKIIIEEKIEGEEFTVQCFVHGKYLLPTPAVQDFKKLLPGEKGPNTASMGSYSQHGHLLPFMEEKDYEKALEIIRGTIDGFQKETGEICSGFLYGQFMVTAKGVKLIEYNFRPGDPEWMNTVMILKNNLLEVILKLFKEEEQELYFEKQATVCKYIVPEGYP